MIQHLFKIARPFFTAEENGHQAPGRFSSLFRKKRGADPLFFLFIPINSDENDTFHKQVAYNILYLYNLQA